MRMKTILTAAIAAASLALGANAFAGIISIDTLNLNDAPLLYGSPVTGTFDILGINGYTATNDVVTDVVATFVIDDGTGVPKNISFDLSGDSTNSFSFKVSRADYAFLVTSQDNSAVEQALETTGLLDFSVSNSNPRDTSLKVDSAMLAVYWYDPPPSVPDGGSAITLLGMALLGISAAARKFGFLK